jgi:hypothetical protein
MNQNYLKIGTTRALGTNKATTVWHNNKLVSTKKSPFVDFSELKETTTKDYDLLYYQMMNGNKKMTLKDAAKNR